MSSGKGIAVLGLGYVGLTLSVVLARRGFKVYGVDINKKIVALLKKGIPHFYERGLEILLKQQLKLGNLEFFEFLPDKKIDTYILCVATPLQKKTKKPDLRYIRNVIIDVAKHMDKGALVIMRSTIPVGGCRNVVIPLLEKHSGFKVGKDFLFVYSPERTVEGEAILELEKNPQIIGGFNEESSNLASSLFRKITPSIINVSSLEAAELIKIMDNTYRDVLFAYANEIAMICEKLGLNATELINAANVHYPRNNIPSPSPGVGGECLSKDPYFLASCAKKAGYRARIIENARKINEYIPIHIVRRIRAKLKQIHKDVKKAKIFIIGFAFKGQPETSDMRNSTTLWFLDELKKYANNLYGYDPIVEKKRLQQLGIEVCDTLEEGFSNADVVLFMNNHRSYLNLDPLKICRKMNKPAIFYDAWGLFEKELFDEIDGVHYMGVGL